MSVNAASATNELLLFSPGVNTYQDTIGKCFENSYYSFFNRHSAY